MSSSFNPYYLEQGIPFNETDKETLDKVREEALESMLCEGYGIPSTYLNLIYNEEPVKKVMWLDRKFKRNFRNDTETAELAKAESVAE